MKIIKAFDDSEFVNKQFKQFLFDSEIHFWNWGFGDDGRLYFQTSAYLDPTTGHVNPLKWYDYHDMVSYLSIKDMKKIVKEFGHLLVWL